MSEGGSRPGSRSSQGSQRSRKACEWEVDKLIANLQDPNAFFRSKACRDLCAMGKRPTNELSKYELGETWKMLHDVLYKLVLKETDADVKRFTTQAMELMGAPRTPRGTAWEKPELSGGARTGASSGSKGSGSRGSKQQEHPSKSVHLAEGEEVYHEFSPWRAALTKSLRENRVTSGVKNMELVSYRENLTKINRVVSFRGFVPDKDGEPHDRLFFVVDSRTEKAEQVCLSPDVEAVVIWRFKLTKEEYRITGRVRTIRAHRGERKWQQLEEDKKEEEAEQDEQLHYRRIAWNSCAPAERAAFMYPQVVDVIHNRQVDDLIRLALQGLVVNVITHAVQLPSAVFAALDKERTGTVTFEEMSAALRDGAVFMGDNERRLVWSFLDSEGEGEIPYEVFDDLMSQMQVPDNFWVMYLEPFSVERSGAGDAWGNVEVELDAGGEFVKIEKQDLNTWVYELKEGTTGRPQDWHVGPKVD